jgi:hypothetical protein
LLIVLIQSAKQAGIFAEFDFTFAALLCWDLYLLATQAFYMLYLFELHPLNLAPLFKLEFFVVADLTGVVNLTARSLDVAFLVLSVQFRW